MSHVVVVIDVAVVVCASLLSRVFLLVCVCVLCFVGGALAASISYRSSPLHFLTAVFFSSQVVVSMAYEVLPFGIARGDSASLSSTLLRFSSSLGISS